MITLTRLDKRVIVLNAEIIKTIEATPDTLVTLINGDSMMVLDPVEDVVRKAIEHARLIRGFQVV